MFLSSKPWLVSCTGPELSQAAPSGQRFDLATWSAPTNAAALRSDLINRTCRLPKNDKGLPSLNDCSTC